MQNEQCQHIRFKGNTLGDDICADCGLSEMQITHRASVENEQMLRLAERLEKATGPDRELDDAIADAVFTNKHRVCVKGLSDEAGGMWMFRHPNGSIGSSLRFSGSLDAAITLAGKDAPDLLRAALNSLDDRFALHMQLWPEGERFSEWLARYFAAAALRSRTGDQNND